MSARPKDRDAAAAASRKSDAQRWASILVGAAVVGVVGWMAYEGLEASRPRPVRAHDDAGDASPPSAIDAGAPVVAAVDDADAGLFLPQLSLGDAAVIPSTAPKSVKLGVVLIAYAGAEGAPATARSKAEARVIADRLLADAKADFHHAVGAGDSGSSDDIGRIPRGVLDPHTEVSVFALGSGDVSDVLETPRGYWIVKRID